MKNILILIVACFVNISVFGSGNTEVESVFRGKYVVTPLEIKNKDVILVDARRWSLRTIKNAVVIDWKELAACDDGKPGDANWGVILDKPRLDKVLGKLGLDMNKFIVVFGDCNKAWGEEGRIVWELLSVGYQNVKFVDGGYKALVAAGFETSFGGIKLSSIDVSTKPVNKAFSIDTDELKKDYEKFKIIDTRTEAEYRGAVKYGEAKGGRLPNAISLKFNDFFQSNGLLKSNADIEAMIQSAGIKKTDKIVTYCTAGIRAAYVYLIFEMLGYNAKNYDESFYRWCKIYDVE